MRDCLSWPTSIIQPARQLASSNLARALTLVLLLSSLFPSLNGATPPLQNAPKPARSQDAAGPPSNGRDAKLKTSLQTPAAAPTDHLTPNSSAGQGSSETSPAARQIEIGQMYEKQGRLSDAEKAYAKALESASGTERETAQKCLRDILAKEEGFQNKYFTPSLEKASQVFLKLCLVFSKPCSF